MGTPVADKATQVDETDTALDKDVANLKKQVEESGKKIEALNIETLMAENKRLSERAFHWYSKYSECLERSHYKKSIDDNFYR